MATSNDWTLTGLDNPLTIQQALLTRFENETGAAVVDNNNPACVLMEAFASISSKQMKMMDDTVRPAIYPARAVTTMDLMKHISDYDYVDIFSAPCTATILLIVEKNYIMTHSLEVPGKKYKRLEVPRSTIISIGEHKFGLYYPIEFRTDMESGQFSVLYDTTVENPLKTLETNVLDFEFREYNGLKLAYIKIPVYQFDITCHDLQMINSSGFKQKVDYSNRFYALRCWADVLQNFGHDESEDDVYERQELSLAVAGQMYDPTAPTVVFTPDEENKECLLEVPYIYFTEKRIRGTLHVEIYTTEGELNYQVPYNTEETCIIDMLSNISADEDDTYNASYYAEPFRTMPGLHALPLSSVITGGSNGLDFDQIRYRVINGANTNVLQTPADISAYFAAYGYTATLYRDGITDRIFIVHAAIRDADDEVIGMDCISTQFDFSRLDEYSSIIKTEDSSSTYTVLPSTLYRYDLDKQICVPLTDTEKTELDGLSVADRVSAYNNNVFTLSPFHLQINASKRYPTTITYDMLQVKRMARTFIAARDDQYGLALNSVNLDVYRRDGDNADRYRLTFRVSRVGFGSNIPVMETSEQGQAEKKIRVLIGLKNDDGELYWAEAQWVTSEAGDMANSTNEVFELILTPNYIFHQANNEHTVQMAFWDDNTFTDFFLTSECRVLLMMKNNLIISTESGEMITFDGEQSLNGGTPIGSGQVVLPTSKRVSLNSEIGFSNYFVMTEQKCVFKFGSPIDELDQRINLTYSEAVYKKHLTTKFRTLEEPRYVRDEKGDLIVEYTYKSPDKESYISRDITYYVKVDDTYVPATIEESAYNNVKVKNYTKQNLLIRSATPTIVELYPKGTLTCMAESGKELVTPNKYTAKNYLGCTKITKNSEGEEVKSLVTEEDLETSVKSGTSLSIENCPIVPRFEIKTSITNSIIGKYELQNALTAKPISSLDNVWSKLGFCGGLKYVGVDTTSMPIKSTKYYVVENPSSLPKVYRPAVASDFTDEGKFKTDREFYTLEIAGTISDEAFRVNYRIAACNALLHVLNNLVTVREASTGPDPLNDLYVTDKFEPGTFLVLENDYSTPDVMQIQGDLGESPASKVYTRLYYKFRSRTAAEIESGTSEKYVWLCIAQGKSLTTMINHLIREAKEGTYYTKTTDTVRNLTKVYFIKNADETFREAVESDFSETGAFVAGTDYYEKREYNPKYYGFMYTLDRMRPQNKDDVADIVEKQLYVAFQTMTVYTSRLTNYVETTDEQAIASKRYFVADGESYREATEDDFNDDGSFISGTVYYEQKCFTGTYDVPDFAMMEKSAWEAHEIKMESTDATVVEGRTYYYLNKDLYNAGVRKWVNLNEERGLIKDHPINEYIDIKNETGDGKLYYAKSKADCTDKDYAWEQNANRWPWEMKNWMMVTSAYDPADSVTVMYHYLSKDEALVVASDYDRSRRYWEYSTEQVILDEDFYPLEDYTKPRSIQYLVDMLQIDAKHAQVTANKADTRIASDFGDDGPTANKFPTTIVNVLRTHFDNVGKARDTMFTNTRLFFEPVKSLGFATFNIGNNVKKELQLDITMKFRLHVTKEAYEDDILLEQMKARIIAIIDEHIDGGYVNCAEIAAKITAEMDGTVKWVDILGINGDPDLQTMKCDDEDVLPHLSHKLTLSSDGVTVDITRGLTIEAVVNA